MRENGGKTLVTASINNPSRVPPQTMSVAAKNSLAAKSIGESDLLYMSVPLIYEGANLNNDVFLADEMKAAYKTMIGTQVDKDHDLGIDAIVGKNYDAHFDTADGLAVITVDFYIYANLYPDLELKIYDGTITGVSMETWFEWAERSLDRRVLHGLKFVGSGLVRIPAEPKAQLQITDKPAEAMVRAGFSDMELAAVIAAVMGSKKGLTING